MIELFRRDQDPWGQDILIGVSWDLMWAAVVLAAVFLVAHALWYRSRGFAAHATTPAPAPAGVPERVQRHSLAARIFHWSMSACMLTLLVTAFVPVMGLEIPAWVTIHWIAGVALIASVIYHIIHSIGWQDFWSMMSFGPSFFRDGAAQMKHIASSGAPEPKAGKYPFDHRMYHHAVIVASLAAIATGVVMMMRIDTPFFERNPYLVTDSTAGIIFAIHGIAGVGFILLIASHIYFALRPDKRWLLWSMVRGWIPRDVYAEHFDPSRWNVTGDSARSGKAGSGALADASVSAPAEDA
ncbi:MAG: cytochrome b/b6 domain-containing protein [Longimicrobiales bacterium]